VTYLPTSEGLDEEQLKQLGRIHWRKYCPKLFRALKKSGNLEERLNAAVRHTIEAYKIVRSRLEQRGWEPNQSHWSAWEQVREEWLLLRDEEYEKEVKQKTKERRPDPFIDLIF
jgi:NRPS condensation-like uncharacterized protein